MNDCMTQEDAMNMDNKQAIQILEPLRKMMIDQNGCPISDAVFALDKAIKALSERHWIPCSERLPEESDEDAVEVLVTYGDGKWVDVDEFIDGDFVYHNGVTAWMPLPEPYKG